MRTIVVAFQGFPTQGRYGLVNKGDRMGLWSPWSGSDWNPDKNLTRGTGWLDELQFAQSISFPTDKLGSGTIYTFEIVTEKGVYLESEDAKLEKGVGSAVRARSSSTPGSGSPSAFRRSAFGCSANRAKHHSPAARIPRRQPSLFFYTLPERTSCFLNCYYISFVSKALLGVLNNRSH